MAASSERQAPSGPAGNWNDRHTKALTEVMTALQNQGRVRGADGLFLVVSSSGREYLVDAEVGRCECDDYRYREAECKHIKRVHYATGRKVIPPWVDSDAIDSGLGEFVDGAPRIARRDGGTEVLDV